MRIDSPVMTNAQVTGSFSGSFTGVGNFVGLTADSVEYADVLNKPTLISSSAQITITESQISDLDHYTDADVKSKLNSDAVVSGSATNVRSFLNVEDGADVTDTANVTAAGALMDSEVTNLAQVKAFDSSDYATAAQGTTADNALPKAGGQMTGNITFSGTQTVDGRDLSVDGAKLDNIEANADVTDTANVTAAGALMDSEVDADIKTLSLPANTTISSFAKTFLDDADAAAVRATIGAEASGADNSTDVTLDTSSYDYLSISGQAITLGQIDISDDTNFGISDTTGQTGINLTLTGDTLSGVVSGLDTTSNVQFNNLTVSGDLTVSGTTTSINSTDLNVTDKLISINRGGSTAASADGGGLFISGANESITWDNGNSRFNFSDDVHAAGNITLTGTVDGRDVAADGTKLDGIDSEANNYVHPTHPGDDIDVDTGALTGATVISDLDFNITTDTLGHVTDANAVVATRDLTKGDIGLGNVENTALSTWAGSTNLTTLGTIGTGTWNGSVIASAYLDADTAHLSGGQTFSGQKTFTSPVDIRNTSLNIENSGGSAVSTLSHNGTHTKIESHLGGIILDNMGTSGGTLQVTGSLDTDSQATLGGTLRVKSSGLFGNSTTYYAKIQGNSTNGAEILGSTNGSFGANTGIAIAGSTVTVRSTLRATGDVVAYYSSDERLKDNVVEIDGALEKIEALRGVSFDWNDKQDVYEGHDVGVIAQEVEAVLPELVQTRDNGYKAVKYEKLTAVLIQAVKELSAKVKELENK